jgi:eukaryotic-like serine/threonine-protein kinase
MVTGERAFLRETGAETMTAILREEPGPPPAALAMPPAVDRIVRHCLEKKREARFQSARDLAFALEAIGGAPSTGVAAPPADLSMAAPRRRWATAAIAVAAGAAIAAAAFAIGRRGSDGASPPSLPTFRQLTFSRGLVPMARFAPDGHTVIYSAAWNGGAPRLFLTRLESPGATPLSLPDGVLYAVSRTGEIAMGLADVHGSVLQTAPRTLAQAPILSASVRPLLEQVTFADWSPTDGALAVVRVSGSHQRLEFPLGHLLFETDGEIG